MKFCELELRKIICFFVPDCNSRSLSSETSLLSTASSVSLLRKEFKSHHYQKFPYQLTANKMSAHQQEEAENLLAQLLVAANLPFNLVENDYFKRFLAYLRPSF